MDVTSLDSFHRSVRGAIRALLMVATREEMERELAISREMGDRFRADCIRELLDES